MIVWNQDNIKILRKYLDNFILSQNRSIPFFIISWSKNIGKTTAIQSLIKEYLGQFFANDFLYIRDLAGNYDWDIDKIKKNHSLKVQLSKKKEENFLEMTNGLEYHDLGIREINLWLQQSKVWSFKAVLLENIERMTPEASNAFLKTCEEPLPWRIIFATTSHQSQLLDTILSRAIIIKFNELTNADIKKFIVEKWYFEWDDKFIDFVANISMWRPWVVVKLHDIFEKNDLLKQDFIKLVDLLKSKKSIFAAQDILKNLNNNGYIDSFIDWWIAYCVENDMFEQAKRWLETKKMLKNNVWIENLILYWLL